MGLSNICIRCCVFSLGRTMTHHLCNLIRTQGHNSLHPASLSPHTFGFAAHPRQPVIPMVIPQQMLHQHSTLHGIGDARISRVARAWALSVLRDSGSIVARLELNITRVCELLHLLCRELSVTILVHEGE